jgi:hypothetical protein
MVVLEINAEQNEADTGNRTRPQSTEISQTSSPPAKIAQGRGMNFQSRFKCT